jgi:formylglycine-generating enzyme required for sulfatase activity
MKTIPPKPRYSSGAHRSSVGSVLRTLIHLPLLLVSFWAAPMAAQNTSQLGLEQSTDLQNWQSFPVTPEMLDSSGKIIPSSHTAEHSYRLQINVLPTPTGGTPPSSATPPGANRLGLEQSDDLATWLPITLTESMLNSSGKIQLPAPASKSFYRLNVLTVPSGPTILAPLSSPGTYTGTPATLSITVAGGPHYYYWYQGNPGDTSNHLGTTTTGSFFTGPLAATSTFWVRVVDGADPTGNTFVDSAAVTVTVTDSATLDAFTLIPAGSFTMGNTAGDADITDAAPVSVNVSAFYIGKYEVTQHLWSTVRTWALNPANGYTDIPAGAGKYSSHPVVQVTWHDVLVWCNARSEMEGLTPVYSFNGEIVRSNVAHAQYPTVNWTANGYRLPTEAEWEKAARGGSTVSNQRFPWGDSNNITHNRANYSSDETYEIPYDASITRGYHPAYNLDYSPYTSPVGSFSANGYGLHDVAGNVMEQCWDGYAPTYAAGAIDPRGFADYQSVRVLRGGNWIYGADLCRVAARTPINSQNTGGAADGFRLARSIAPPTITLQPGSTTILSGATTTLTVAASGTAPLTYQWYQGSAGTTTTPVGTNSASFTTPALTATTNYWVRVSNAASGVNSATATLTVHDMEIIPAGSFTMGRTSGDTDSNAPPVTVTVSEFSMGKYEVTKALWDVVRNWGAENGYTDLSVGSGKAGDHPVYLINWFDMVKWCNARSQKDGLTPVYTVSVGTIMKTGTSVPTANWSANGYRLPTEAEWEKAARGGQPGNRFPWGDTITHDQANYQSKSDYSYDLSGALNAFHPTYATGSHYTSPVGTFAANGYGLYNMAGNVYEWCWDWYGASTYGNEATDPRGAAAGEYRVTRGGSWYAYADESRVANRSYGFPGYGFGSLGFRLARSSVSIPPVPNITSQPGSATILSGETKTLTVAASGTAPFSYQWYQGSSGDKALPVGTNSASFTTPALNATNRYWVLVSNAFGSVDSATATVTVDEMALISAGNFQMGDNFAEGNSDELPVHTVNVSAFYMGKYEVTKELWDSVLSYGAANGYTDLPTGLGKGANHPVHTISWYDIVKWCNARSEQAGLIPCYTVSGAVYKTGSNDAVECNWNASGYRLPTEAEWEKAARGGLIGKRFPWGDTISHNQANYYAEGIGYGNQSGNVGYHPSYDEGGFPYSSPVGSFDQNGYGLYNMAGNMYEWVWDRYGSGYYATSPSADPRGATSGAARVVRGGSWFYGAFGCRAAVRGYGTPSLSGGNFGFRSARSSVP